MEWLVLVWRCVSLFGTFPSGTLFYFFFQLFLPGPCRRHAPPVNLYSPGVAPLIIFLLPFVFFHRSEILSDPYVHICCVSPDKRDGDLPSTVGPSCTINDGSRTIIVHDVERDFRLWNSYLVEKIKSTKFASEWETAVGKRGIRDDHTNQFHREFLYYTILHIINYHYIPMPNRSLASPSPLSDPYTPPVTHTTYSHPVSFTV